MANPSTSASAPEAAASDPYARIVAAFPPAERTLPRILTRQAERYGDRVLLRAGAVEWTFRDTVAMAARWAGHLRDAGVTAGDRVAILSGNRA